VRTLRRAFLFSVLAVGSFAGYVWWGLPSARALRALAHEDPQETSVMRQREREAAQRGRKLARVQERVPLQRVSRHLIRAVVTAEDAKFFDHEGFDWEAIKQSAEKDWKEKRFARGGSTITQQLAKNLFFTTHKSPIRKLREFLVAWRLEQELGKPRILELYLNVIEWGEGLYGCEAAARRYYGKSAAALDETEAAGLAAMIPAPRSLNPVAAPRRHAAAQRRILWLMAQAGYLKNALGVVPATEPPKVTIEEDEEPEPASPEPAATPEPAPSPEPTPTPSASPLQ
jgi:monofunctional biosynthetic peptidoglycan transglycosylase